MQLFIDASVEKFIRSLGMPAAAKVDRTISLIEEFGYQLSMPHSRHINKGVFELRVRGKQEIRIFYCFHNNAVYLLHGFIKQSQQTPRKELDIAFSRMKHLT